MERRIESRVRVDTGVSWAGGIGWDGADRTTAVARVRPWSRSPRRVSTRFLPQSRTTAGAGSASTDAVGSASAACRSFAIAMAIAAIQRPTIAR